MLVGGIALNFGAQGSSYRVGAGRDFVIEGDEYDSAFFDKTAKFLKYLPDIAVINNIEFDHADIYADLDEVRLAFRRLVEPRAAQRAAAARRATARTRRARRRRRSARSRRSGSTSGATWQAHDDRARDGLTRFDVRREGKPFGRFESPLLGVHNVRNALAAIAVGAQVGLTPQTLADGLRAFKGIKRRLETVGVARGVTVLDDFAHHPTAVHETLSALRTGYPGRRDLGGVRAALGFVVPARVPGRVRRRVRRRGRGRSSPAVFRSSLPEAERLSAEQLVDDLHAQGRHARHIPDIDDIIATIVAEHRDGDVVVLMSNGGFGGIHRKLLQALRE